MRNRTRIFSLAVAVCMLLTVFSFSPSVFAQSDTQIQQQTREETSPHSERQAPLASVAEPAENPAAKASAQTQTAPEDPEEPAKEPSENPPQEPAEDPEEETAIYNITTRTESGSGSIDVDKQQAKAGETVSYTITPATGYKLTSAAVGGSEIAIANPYQAVSGTFTVAADTVVSASFAKLETFQITTSVNSSSKGSITASPSVTENGSVTITAKAKSGYYLSDLQVDGVSVGAKRTYTFSNVTQDHTVKAIFSKQVKIMLDAGHYGKYNRSPVYSSYYESNMTWTLHNYLKEELLEYSGFAVGVTRKDQKKDMNVYNRGTASKGYDLFLSLHSNAVSSKSTDYPLIITQKGNTGDSLAKKLGKVIEDTMNTKQSYKVWQKLNKDNKTEYYGVLRGAKAVGTKGMIIEHSFHTNLAATKWLSSNSNLKKMAKAEAEVLAGHYGMSKDGSAGVSVDSEASSSSNKSSGSSSASKVVSTSQKVKVLVGSLHMRKSYSTSSRSMGKAKKNKVYQLKAKTKDGKWGQLKTNGYWIYLKNGYTKVVASSSSSVKTVKSSQRVKVVRKNLKFRKTPSTKGTVAGKAKKNKIYRLKAKTSNGKWGQLKTNGYWIYLSWTKPVKSTKIVKTSKRVRVKVSSLRMRKSCSTSSKTMGRAKKNRVYRLKARTKDGRWGQLKTNGYWIYLKNGYTKTV